MSPDGESAAADAPVLGRCPQPSIIRRHEVRISPHHSWSVPLLSSRLSVSRVDVAAATRDLLRTTGLGQRWPPPTGPGVWWPIRHVAPVPEIITRQPVLVPTDAVRPPDGPATRAIPGFVRTRSRSSSSSGDFGYTYGTNRIAAESTGTLTHTAEGRYVKAGGSDSRWRCSVDISNEGPAAKQSSRLSLDRHA